MRSYFAAALNNLAMKDKKIMMLIGDLGYGVFDQLEKNLGERFIDAGVAEHNMVTLAAGLAYAGFKPWLFSITPFVTVKVIEELRNDICWPNLNVKIVGLGGGYDYEFAGSSHHGIEDVAAMMLLPNMKIYAPAVASDLEIVVKKMSETPGPAYLRLTKARQIAIKLDKYKNCRQVNKGNKATIVVLGSIIDQVSTALELLSKNKKDLDVWVISCLPLVIPPLLLQFLKKTKKLCVIEEHIKSGGLGQILSHDLHQKNLDLKIFKHLFIQNIYLKQTGSRDYYLRQSGLDAQSIVKTFKSLING